LITNIDEIKCRLCKIIGKCSFSKCYFLKIHKLEVKIWFIMPCCRKDCKFYLVWSDCRSDCKL